MSHRCWGDAVYRYFLVDTHGWRLVAHVLAPIVWFQIALLMSGVYARYNAAQQGRPLEETPFFDEAVAVLRLDSVAASDGVQTAFLFYVLDAVNALLLCAGFAALIGFGLRALRTQGPLVWAALAAPLILCAAELTENAFLAMALAMPASQGTLGGIAGVGTGIKFLAFALSALFALTALIAGLGAWTWRRMREEKRR